MSKEFFCNLSLISRFSLCCSLQSYVQNKKQNKQSTLFLRKTTQNFSEFGIFLTTYIHNICMCTIEKLYFPQIFKSKTKAKKFLSHGHLHKASSFFSLWSIISLNYVLPSQYPECTVVKIRVY